MKLKLDENLGRIIADVFRHTLIAGLGKGDITGKLWIVQEGRIREYQGPG